MKKYLPFIILISYVLFSYLIFEIGPWPWPIDNWPLLRIYMFASFFSMFVGYFIAVNIRVTRRIELLKFTNTRFNILLTLALFSMLLISYARAGTLFPNVLYGIAFPGSAYSAYVARTNSGGIVVLLEYINILVHSSFYIVVVVGVCYWRALKPMQKCIYSLILLYYIFIYVAIGVNKGVVAVIIPLPLAYALIKMTDKVDVAKLIKYGISLSLLFIAFLVYFTAGQIDREGGVATSGSFGPPLSITTDRSSYFPENVSIAWESFSRYLSQGYFALGKALEVEYENFGYGISASMFLMRKMDQSWLDNTLVYQLETQIGWGVFELWHSLPTWLINGFGVIGSLIVLGILGFMLGRVWKRLLIYKDIIDLAKLYLLVTIFLYFPANNQIFQAPDSTIAFILIYSLPAIFITLSSAFKR